MNQPTSTRFRSTIMQIQSHTAPWLKATRACLMGIALFACPSVAFAQDLQRPCGPDSMTGPLRLLIPQGVSGGDFRSACVRHDACYDEYGRLKPDCDARFRSEMMCACNQSRHPVLCRFVAHMMHRVTTRRGQEAFDSAQQIAASKLFAQR